MVDDCYLDPDREAARIPLLDEMCVTPTPFESAPVSIVRDLVSIGIADGAVRSSND
jgi:hypothetical protein